MTGQPFPELRELPGAVRGTSFSWLRAGPSDRPVEAVFLHANGFPPRSYAAFLRTLGERMAVLAMPLRPLWARVDPAVEWADLGWDLLAALDHAELDQVLVIGHSLGATAVMPVVAARPERFRGLVLVEPAMVHPWQAQVLRWLPRDWALRVEPARGAARRRDWWPDRGAYLESCRRSGVYDRFDPEALDALADAALVEGDGGVTLAFSSAWEAHVLTQATWPGAALRGLQVPVVGVRGRSSMFLDDVKWQRCKRAIGNGWYEQLPEYGHLLPLEGPRAATEAIWRGLAAQRILE